MSVSVPERSFLASPVGALMRPTNRIASEDSLERAAAEMRMNGCGLIPVVNGDQLRGIVSDTSLAVAFAEGGAGTESCEVALVPAETIAPYATGAEALRRLAEGDGRPLVVVDDMGRPLGLLSACDLYASRRPLIRPTAAGGMATPFGVYLTTGAVSAGAPWWGLMATGAVMCTLLIASAVLCQPLFDWMVHQGLSVDASRYVDGGVTILLFLVGMRLIPLSGTHGAEHMVVHAIERGEPLTPDVVRRMPRIHPRCGTNLAAGMAIFMGIWHLPQPADDDLRFMLAAIAMWLFWRPLGSFLQGFFTTRRPSERQLNGAIHAGEELLEAYVRAPNAVATIPRRLWNTGLAFVLIGSTLTGIAIQLLGQLFHVNLGLW